MEPAPDPCNTASSIEIDVTQINGHSKMYYESTNTINFGLIDKTQDQCGVVIWDVTYTPLISGGTEKLISLLASGLKTVAFSNGTQSDVGEYTITISAKFDNQADWLTIQSATYTYQDPCASAVVTAPPLEPLDVEVYSIASQILDCYDSISSFYDPNNNQPISCGSFTLKPVNFVIKPPNFQESTMASDFKTQFEPSQHKHKLIVSPTNPLQVGQYELAIPVCLTSYPSQCASFTQQVTITPCIPRPQVGFGQSSGWASQTYVLFSTKNYYMQLTIQNCCDCTSKDWQIQAGQPSTGTNPNEFTSTSNIVASSGLYQIPINSLRSNSSFGIYIVQISHVLINDTKHYGLGQEYQFVGATSFNLNVLHPCAVTVVTASNLTHSLIDIAVWDSPVSINFDNFSDKAASNSYPPNSCVKDYIFQITPLSNASNNLSSLLFNASTRTLQIESIDISEIGVYNVSFTGFIKDYPLRNATSSFILNITDPCFKTQLKVPDNSPKLMTTSVLIQASPGGAPLFITQQIDVFKDSISIDYGDMSGAQYCGPREFSISSSPTQALTATLNSSEIYVDYTGLVFLYTARSQILGMHKVTIQARLTQYPNVAQQSVSFDVQITPCEVTQIQMTSLSPSNDQTYRIADPQKIWSLTKSSLVSQVPSCGYPVVLESSAPTDILTVTQNLDQINYSIESRDLDKSGVYSVTVKASLNDYVFDPPRTAPTCEQSFTLSVTNVCFETQITTVPLRVENLITFAGFNITSQEIYSFNDTETVSRTQETDQNDFCGQKLFQFTLNATESSYFSGTNGGTFDLAPPDDIQEFGEFQAQMFAKMEKYPLITSEKLDFNVTILKSLVPEIKNQIYLIGSDAMSIPFDQFQVLPNDFNIGTMTIEAKILDKQAEIHEKYIDLNCNCTQDTSSNSWINLDSTHNTLNVFTLDETLQGDYTILIIQSFEKLPNIRPYAKFKLSLQKLVIPRTTQIYPYLQPIPPQSLIVEQKCSSQSTEQPWQFLIPTSVDPGNTKIDVQVVLDQKFFSFDNMTQRISQIQVVNVSSQVNKTIKFILKNQNNLTTSYSMIIQFVCIKDKVIANITPQLTLKQPNTIIKEPAQILSMGRSGEVEILFKRVLFIPKIKETQHGNYSPPRQLQQQEVYENISEYINKEVLQVQLKTKFNTSDVEWICKSIQNKTLKLFINFSDPMEISQTHQDQLVLTFIKPEVFLIESGQEYLFSNDSLKVLVVDIPKQLPSQGATALLKSVSQSVQQVGVAVIIVTLLVQIVAKKIITSMWVYYCALQLILLQAQRSNMFAPSSVEIVTESVAGIINLSSLDKQKIAQFLHLDFITSSSIYQSLDGIAITAILILLVVIFCGTAIVLTRKCQRIQNLLFRIKNTLFWNFLIRYFQASFIGFNFAALNNLQKLSASTQDQITSSIILVIQYGVVCFVAYLLTQQKLDVLSKPVVKQRMGNLYSNMDTRKRSQVLFGLVFFFQRTFLVIIVAIKYSFGLQWQLYQLVLQLNTFYLVVFNPYKDQSDQRLVLVNCIFLLISSVMISTYSFWNSDSLSRYSYGMGFNCLVVLQFVVNLAIITCQVAHSAQLKLKQIRFRLKLKRRKKHLQRNQQAKYTKNINQLLNVQDLLKNKKVKKGAISSTKTVQFDYNKSLTLKNQQQAQQAKINNRFELEEILELSELSDADKIDLSTKKKQKTEKVNRLTGLSDATAFKANPVASENKYSAKSQLAAFLANRDQKIQQTNVNTAKLEAQKRVQQKPNFKQTTQMIPSLRQTLGSHAQKLNRDDQTGNYKLEKSTDHNTQKVESRQETKQQFRGFIPLSHAGQVYQDFTFKTEERLNTQQHLISAKVKHNQKQYPQPSQVAKRNFDLLKYAPAPNAQIFNCLSVTAFDRNYNYMPDNKKFKPENEKTTADDQQLQQERQLLDLELQQYYTNLNDGIRRYPLDRKFSFSDISWPYFKQFQDKSYTGPLITPEMHRDHIVKHLKREWVASYPIKPYLPLFVTPKTYNTICDEIAEEVKRIVISKINQEDF